MYALASLIVSTTSSESPSLNPNAKPIEQQKSYHKICSIRQNLALHDCKSYAIDLLDLLSEIVE